MSDDLDEKALAREMIEVHGSEAAGIARGNARTAALAGTVVLARRWIRVLGTIQRQRDGKHQNPPQPSNITRPKRTPDGDVK